MQKQTDFDKLKEIRRKVEIMTIENLNKKNSVKNSIEIQNNLSRKSGSWNGEKEIRKWRENR